MASTAPHSLPKGLALFSSCLCDIHCNVDSMNQETAAVEMTVSNTGNHRQ